MTGSEVENYLNKCPFATLLAEDNNRYLISYRLDSGAEIAFDPRVKGLKGKEASIFVTHKPRRLLLTSDVNLAAEYNPENPSTALGRVSELLDSSTNLYRIRVLSHSGLDALVNWIRWA